MELGLAALVGLIVGLGFAAIAIGARTRAMGRLADEISAEIEPYLRRRAAEIGLDPARPVWTSRHTPKERIEYSVGLARKLLANARGEDPEHSNTALAQTVPAVDSGEVTAPRPRAGDEKGTIT